MTRGAEPWRAPSARRIRTIRDRLRKVYGVPRAEPHGHPIAELVLTVLSQSTNDRNRDVAFLGLRERFPTWEAVRDAPVDEIEQAIRPGGISKVKSVRIKAILKAISESSEPDGSGAADSGSRTARARPNQARPDAERAAGSSGGRPRGTPGDEELSLDWLPQRTVAEAQAYLTNLPGVGRKTAACVLLFALGMHDVPVDTHVSRVSTRLGLLRPGASFEEQHDVFLAFTPLGQELELHLNLLRHGRRTCHARLPVCHECVLESLCPKVGVREEG